MTPLPDDLVCGRCRCIIRPCEHDFEGLEALHSAYEQHVETLEAGGDSEIWCGACAQSQGLG